MKYFYMLIFFVLYFGSDAQTSDQIFSSLDKPETASDEIYFKFRITDQFPLDKITRMISLDQFEDGICYAYASKKEFSEFTKLGINYEILTNPGDLLKNPNMLASADDPKLRDWDFYPTYPAYVDMMYQFAANYPDLCQVYSIGTTVMGRNLLVAKISDNVSVREAEPQFLYTSSIHGDEVTGYILMLRLIDYLLTNYGTNAKVTNLVNGIEIWINPLANPDGTYYSGDNTVSGARRYNANSVDLNRNYPDPQDGQHPDGNAWQPETLAFMELAQENHFVMSANFHGGAEVLNYPWDTWPQLAADNTWWVYVSRQYVDTVHLYSPSTYMDFLNNGITNGYAWYTISGGRQDFMNYFNHCREITMEISDIKLLPTSQLPNHWNWNYPSLLNYMEQCLYGVRGIVTDSISGFPMEAKVEILGHDVDESYVFSAPECGNYHRLLAAGTYDFTFSVPGVPPKTIQGVRVVQNHTTLLNVQLNPGELNADFQASATVMPAGKTVTFTDLSTGNSVSREWWFEGGTPQTSADKNPQNILYQNPGTFKVALKVFNAGGDSSVLTKQDYIKVNSEYLMSNATFVVDSGLFYDSGGENGNYSNSEDFTLTFKPRWTEGKVEVSFLAFNVQSQTSCNYDWLNVFDGAGISSPLIGKYCGTNSPGTILSSSQDGALTFQFHSNSSTTKSGWKAAIACKGLQILSLQAGWNGISTFIQPANSNPGLMFGNIISEIEIIQGMNGYFLPGQNINTLGDWNLAEGYQIKLLNEAIVEISGSFNSGVSVNLNEGWNLVPVLCPVQVAVEEVISGVSQQIVIIKEAVGLQVYWPSADIFTLQHFQPGNSYLIKVSAPVSITFPN